VVAVLVTSAAFFCALGPLAVGDLALAMLLGVRFELLELWAWLATRGWRDQHHSGAPELGLAVKETVPITPGRDLSVLHASFFVAEFTLLECAALVAVVHGVGKDRPVTGTGARLLAVSGA